MSARVARVINFSSLYEELFYKALRIRLVEERIVEVYPSDKVQSPVHLSIGQEAVAVGVCHDLRATDLLFSSYRSHAFYLAKGGDLRTMFAELYGKVAGCGQGKAGSMHLFAPDVGFMLASAVVASTIPHAVGAAFAARRRPGDQVVVVTFGDGATEEGVYHESINFAALHQVPVIFVCENNGLAVHTPLKVRQAYSMVEHARTYGVPALRIAEGYDPLEVRRVMSELVAQVRRDRSPRFIEVETFRYKEHVGPGDDYHVGYRSRADFERWSSRDPLVIDTPLVERLRPMILKEIDEAMDFAEHSAWPGAEHLLSDVI